MGRLVGGAPPPSPGQVQVQVLGGALAPGGGLGSPCLTAWGLGLCWRWSEWKGLGSGLSGRKGPQGRGR